MSDNATHKFHIGKDIEVITTVDELNRRLRELFSFAQIEQSKSMQYKLSLDVEKHYSSSISSASRPGAIEKVAAVMLCCGCFCLIIKLIQMDLEACCCLSQFLQMEGLTFVGVRIQRSLEALDRDYGIKCRNWLDLGQLPLILNGKNKQSLEGYTIVDLANKVMPLGAFLPDIRETRRICNAAAFSDWGAITYSQQQIEAATMRVLLCFYAGHFLCRG